MAKKTKPDDSDPVKRIYVIVDRHGYLLGRVYDDREIAELNLQKGERIFRYIRG